MSNNKPITVAEAARLFGFVAAAMVIVFLAISMEGEPAPVRPAWTLSEGLQRVLWLLGLSVVAVGGLVAFLGLVARHSARTQDTPREGSSLQAINAALIDERNQMEKRVKELERAAAMHHQAMLRQRETHSAEYEAMDSKAKGLLAERNRWQGIADMRLDALQQLQAKVAANQIPLDVTQALALMRYARATPLLTVRGARELIRAEGIALPNSAYAALSAFVKEANTLPHQQAQPVRDAASEKKPANARRERANGRTRTQARTQKVRKA